MRKTGCFLHSFIFSISLVSACSSLYSASREPYFNALNCLNPDRINLKLFPLGKLILKSHLLIGEMNDTQISYLCDGVVKPSLETDEVFQRSQFTSEFATILKALILDG
jgi:hypothetical protein